MVKVVVDLKKYFKKYLNTFKIKYVLNVFFRFKRKIIRVIQIFIRE